DVTFLSGGLSCSGWLLRPDGVSGDRPGIVVCAGGGGVKEMNTGRVAEDFARDGYVALAFDYRYLGASEGTPRGRLVPQVEHDDIRAALEFLGRQPGVAPSRLALWGVSFGGAHAMFVGALDPRVKVVIAQVPGLGIRAILQRSNGRRQLDAFLAQL